MRKNIIWRNLKLELATYGLVPREIGIAYVGSTAAELEEILSELLEEPQPVVRRPLPADLLEQIRSFTRPRVTVAPDYTALGSVDIRTVSGSKRSKFTFNIRDQRDVNLLRTMIENPALIDPAQLPSGYRRIYANRTASGFSALVENAINNFEEQKENDIPAIWRYAIEDNIYSSWGGGQNSSGGSFIAPASGNIADVRMRSFQALKLGHIPTLEYQIEQKDKCVYEFFRNHHMINRKLGKKRIKNILSDLAAINMSGVKVRELTEILNKYDVNLNVYAIDGNLRQSQDTEKFTINIVAHNQHMYVLGRATDIRKTPSSKISLPREEYEQKYEELKTQYRIAKVLNDRFYCDDVEYICVYDNKNKTIEDALQFKSIYGQTDIDFYENSGIRACCYVSSRARKGVRLDLKHSHKSIMENPNNVFPKSDGLSTITSSNKNEDIRKNNFYYFELPKVSPFKELYPGQTHAWIYGDIVKDLGLKNPTRVMKTHSYTSGTLIPPEVSNIDVCLYSGTLAKYESETVEKYYITDPEEAGEFRKTYGSRFRYGKTGDEIIISKSFYMKKSGILAYLAIISYQNRNIFNLWKMNQPATITSIYSDCIGLSFKGCDEIFKFGEQYTTEEGNLFKREPIKFVSASSSTNWACPFQLTKTKRLQKTEFVPGESLLITGKAGVGKSYYTKNGIITQLDQSDLKYIITSSTRENAESWGGNPIQHYLRKSLGRKKILETFRNIDYIIVDECFQLTSDVVFMLDKLKKAIPDLNFIMIGDPDQCLGVDDVNYYNSYVLNRICDYNLKHIEWHANSRFSKEYYDFLEKYLSIAKNSIDFRGTHGSRDGLEHILDHIPISHTIDHNIKNICWTHNYRREKLNNNGSTIHSTQGKTIDEKFAVHELEKLHDYRVVYTAISRATGFKNITVVFTSRVKATSFIGARAE
jgi:hypothetical protein